MRKRRGVKIRLLHRMKDSGKWVWMLICKWMLGSWSV